MKPSITLLRMQPLSRSSFTSSVLFWSFAANPKSHVIFILKYLGRLSKTTIIFLLNHNAFRTPNIINNFFMFSIA